MDYNAALLYNAALWRALRLGAEKTLLEAPGHDEHKWKRERGVLMYG